MSELVACFATRLLRTLLRRLGYAVHGWRMGRNIGDALLEAPLRDRVA